jgi:hypothetical protein
MNRVLSLFILLFSINLDAAIKLNFSGQLLPAEDGDFTGHLIFDVANPDSSDFYPEEDGSYAALYLSYANNTAHSLTINGQAFNFQSNQINIDVINNIDISGGALATQSLEIASSGSIFDLITIWIEGSENQYDEDGNLTNGSDFYLTALFAEDTFDSSDLSPPNYSGILNLPLPEQFMLNASSAGVNGPNLNVLGVITGGNISQIPLPGAVWLFGSIVAWLGFNSRKRFN